MYVFGEAMLRTESLIEMAVKPTYLRQEHLNHYFSIHVRLFIIGTIRQIFEILRYYIQG
jgi:hypothetical protein